MISDLNLAAYKTAEAVYRAAERADGDDAPVPLEAACVAYAAALRAAVPAGEPVKPFTWGVFCINKGDADYRFSEMCAGTEEDARELGEEYYTDQFIVRPLYTHPTPRPDMEMSNVMKSATMVDLKKSLGALAYHISQTGTADKQDAETVLRAKARISDRDLAEARAELIVAPAECDSSCDDPECPYSHKPLTLRQAYENAVARLRKAEAECDALAADKARLEEDITRKDEALEHARHLMWTYGFSENNLQPIRLALSGASIPAPDKAEARREALEEAEAVAENELQEIADGAWGDNPARRGAARALISQEQPK